MKSSSGTVGGSAIRRAEAEGFAVAAALYRLRTAPRSTALSDLTGVNPPPPEFAADPPNHKIQCRSSMSRASGALHSRRRLQIFEFDRSFVM